ncbi:unnamed protein product, partial [Scytosiphon promiscuus]
MEGVYEQLQDDTRSFWQSPSAGVRRLESMPSPSEFFRDYVATSTPVIITGGASACLKDERHCWGDLSSMVGRGSGDLEVTVDFTPDGRGDCVVDVPESILTNRAPHSNGGDTHKSSSDGRSHTGGASGVGDGTTGRHTTSRTGSAGCCERRTASRKSATTAVFVKPEERRMKFEAFVDMLSAAPSTPAGGGRCATGQSSGCIGGGDGVPYLSHQNDSLRQEFPGLAEDVEPSLALAREAFGNEPDAVNLWIGDDRSVSAVHKDHYENMYCVLRGEKHFTLLPPSDVLFLYEQEFPQGRYRQSNHPDDDSDDAIPGEEAGGRGRAGKRKQKFEVEMEDGTVPWIPVDPDYPDLGKYPLFRYASPVKCRVGPGDILYLPALWYHRVSQKGITVAVNYWHDMQFDQKYVYYRLLQSLAGRATAAVAGEDVSPL